MKELTGQIQKMMDELYDLEYIQDSRIQSGVQGASNHHSQYASTSGALPGTEDGDRGQAMGVPALPRGRSTLQLPQRGGRGHERKESGDRRLRGGEKGEDRRGFTSTLYILLLCF